MNRRHHFHRISLTVGALAVVALFAGACSSSTPDSGSSQSSSAAQSAGSSSESAAEGSTADASAGTPASTSAESEQQAAPPEKSSATILTNYFAQAEQGGYWDTAINQYGKSQGVTIDVRQGGPGIATTPQVASGSFDFGVGNADDVLIARAGGLPIVVLTAPVNKTLFVLMAHKESGITDFSQVNGHQVAVRQGAAYWDYVKAKYELNDVQQINFTGSMAEFKANPDLVQQGYATADVYSAQKNGIDINVLSVADQANYNPYGQVLFASENFVKENPNLVRIVVQATIKGWQHFVEDPADARTSVLKTNADMDPEIFDASVAALQSGDWFTSPIGSMTADRWNELHDQLALIGAVPADMDVASAWTLDYQK